jgi:hypothetical protein
MCLDIKRVLEKFPKVREPLSRQTKKIFNKEYLNNRKNILSQISESWMHLSIKGRNSKKIISSLEIGAGNLNHLKYEGAKNLLNYSIIEPKKFLLKDNKDLKIVKIYQNLNQVKKKSVHRIISCAVLEHLTDLPKFLVLSSKCLKKKGYQSHSIPCEGYPLWHLAWNIVSGVPFKIRTGLDFREIQKHEHVNNYNEIIALIRYFYKEVKIKFSYPFFLTPYLSLYANITFCNPNNKSINQYLKLKKIS